MSDWMNWQDFSAANETPLQQQADEREMMYAQQRAQIEKALSSLGDQAAASARDGRFGNVSQLSGYSALMGQRDKALQQETSVLGAAPWEADMRKPGGEQQSPWADLSKRLGTMNNKYAQANTERVNQQRHEQRMADMLEFQKQQEKKLKDANATKDKATQDYIAWSDAVKYAGQTNGGAGAGAYYNAAQGTGPRPVQQSWGNSPNVRDMQKKLDGINKNQLMPKDNRGFGNQPPGSNGWW